MSELSLERFIECLNANETSVVQEGIDGFIKSTRTEEENKLVELYVRSSPQCLELFNWWEDITSGRAKVNKGTENGFITSILDALSVILHYNDTIRNTKRQLVKRLLLEKMKYIHSFLTTSKDTKLVQACIKLLTGIVKDGAVTSRELYYKLSFPALPISNLCDARGRTSLNGTTRYGSVRHRFMQLIVALLKYSDVNIKKRMLEPKGVVQSILKRLSQDPSDMVKLYLEGLREFVLNDHSIGRKVKIALMHPQAVIVENLLPLYHSNDDETRSLIHDFVIDALTSKEMAIFPFERPGASQEPTDRASQQIASRRKCFSIVVSALQPIDNELHMKLALRLFEVDAELRERQFSGSMARFSLDPRPSFRWIKAVAFVCKLLKSPLLPPPPQIIKLSKANLRTQNISKIDWDEICDQILARASPSTQIVSKMLLNKGIQHTSSLVVVQTLDLLMCIICSCHAALEQASRYLSSYNSDIQMRQIATGKLSQRIPDVNIILALLTGKKKEHWEPKELEWVQLRAVRTIYWYTKRFSLSGRVDFAKLLSKNNTNPDKRTANDFVYNLSVIQGIENVGANSVSWVNGQNIVYVETLLKVRAQIWNQGGAHLVDSTVCSVLLGVVGLDETNDCFRRHALAWVNSIQGDVGRAVFVSKVVSQAVKNRGLSTSCDQLVTYGLAIAASLSEQRLVCGVIVEILFAMPQRLSFLFLPQVNAKLQELKPHGPSILSFVRHAFGFEKGLESIAVSRANISIEELSVCIGDPRPDIVVPEREGFLISFVNALSTADDSRLFSEQGFSSAYQDTLYSLGKQCTLCDDAVSTVSRVTGAYIARHGLNVREEHVAFCFDLLQMFISKSSSVARLIFDSHPVLREFNCNMAISVQLRIAQIVQAVNSSSFTFGIQLANSALRQFSSTPGEEHASILFAIRHHLGSQFEASLLSNERLFSPEISRGPVEQTLAMHILKQARPDGSVFRIILKMTEMCNDEIDSVLLHCCNHAFNGKYVPSSGVETILDVILDPTSKALLSSLWGRPTAMRAKVLDILVRCSRVADMFLEDAFKKGLGRLEHSLYPVLVCCVHLRPDSNVLLENAEGLSSFFWNLCSRCDALTLEEIDLMLCLGESRALQAARDFNLQPEVCKVELFSEKRLKMFSMLLLNHFSIVSNRIPLFLRVCLFMNNNLAMDSINSLISILENKTASELTHSLKIYSAQLLDLNPMLFPGVLQLFKRGVIYLEIDDVIANEDFFAKMFDDKELLETRYGLARSWLYFVETNPDVACPKSKYTSLLSAYRCTLEKLDCVFRRIIEIYWHRSVVNPFVETYLYGVNRMKEDLSISLPHGESEVSLKKLVSVVLLERFEWLQSEIDFASSVAKRFPLYRELCPGSENVYTMVATEPPMNSNGKRLTTTTKNRREKKRKTIDVPAESYNELFDSDNDEQANEENEHHEPHTPPRSGEVSHNSSIDPSFALHLLDQFMVLHAILGDLPQDYGRSDEKNTGSEQDSETGELGVFPARKLIETGAISYCIWGLASQCSKVRKLASSVLQRYGQLAIREKFFRERTQTVLLLRGIRNARTSSDTPVPPLICSFLAAALDVLLRPSHIMYAPINSFLLQRPFLDLEDVPMFYTAFNSGTPLYQVERGWIIRVIHHGIRSKVDINILSRRHVISVMLSFFSSPCADLYMQQQVIQVLLCIANVGDYGVRQLLKAGLLVWAANAFHDFANKMREVPMLEPDTRDDSDGLHDARVESREPVGIQHRERIILHGILELFCRIADTLGMRNKRLNRDRVTADPLCQRPVISLIDTEVVVTSERLLSHSLAVFPSCTNATFIGLVVSCLDRFHAYDEQKMDIGGGMLELPLRLLRALAEEANTDRYVVPPEVKCKLLALFLTNRYCNEPFPFLESDWEYMTRWALELTLEQREYCAPVVGFVNRFFSQDGFSSSFKLHIKNILEPYYKTFLLLGAANLKDL